MQPRRVDSGRPASAEPRLGTELRALAALALAVVSSGCTAIGADTPGGARPAPELRALWSDYIALPGRRALAIAGELRRNQWVAGASAGHASSSEAELGALRECQKRRYQRRIVAACRIYAIDDTIEGGASP